MRNSSFESANPQGSPEPEDILDVSVVEWARTRRESPQPAPAQLASAPDRDAPAPQSPVTSRAVDASPLPPVMEISSPRAEALADRPSAPYPATEPTPTEPAYVLAPPASPPLTEETPEAATEATQEGPNWFILLLRETAETVVLAVIIFMLIRVGIQNYRIEGSSMSPNFHHGEYLLVNKLAYRLGEYHRGDVIVFQYPNDPSKDYIKRVIGLPGDTVEIRDRVLYINGSSVDEPYDIMPMSSIPSGPTLVEPGTLYVMGDNRPASSDTRDWGLLDQDLVIGKAWLAIYPFQIFGLVQHPDLQLTNEMAQGP